ncbi:MAG TPA: hypothetical protein VMV10_26325 [Pirellulales bacterium]|nr:hypothetical protein [Pirellulales bacterium]
MNKTSRSVVTDFQLTLRFESVRKQLLEPRFADCLDRALAFYAVSSDRHLPLALIRRSIRELINTPLDQLQAVPGIGPKKLGILINLLGRAVELGPNTASAACADATTVAPQAATVAEQISEAAWEQCRATIRQHGLGREPLGRFAESLRRLPRTLWSTRFNAYLELSLAEIRERKSHGEKRVAAILEICARLHQLLLRVDEQPHLSVHLSPRFATRLQRWLLFRLEQDTPPGVEEIDAFFVAPLLEQLGVDGGETHVDLLRDRLSPNRRGLGYAARQLGLARGRAYELLAETHTIFEVRWPEGRSLAEQLLDKMNRGAGDSEAALRFATAAGLFFRGTPRQSKTPRQGKTPPLAAETDESGRLLQAAMFCPT